MTSPKVGDDSPSVRASYADLLEVAGRYWRAYGGTAELTRSPYVHFAVAVTILTQPYWVKDAWYSVSMSVLPNLLGFAIAGFAVWIGWGDPSFRKLLIETEASDSQPSLSAYEQLSATFAHFAVVQTTALTFAAISSALAFDLSAENWLAKILETLHLGRNFFEHFTPYASAAGFFLFVYAVITTLETTLALFRLSTWFIKWNEVVNELDNRAACCADGKPNTASRPSAQTAEPRSGL